MYVVRKARQDFLEDCEDCLQFLNYVIHIDLIHFKLFITLVTHTMSRNRRDSTRTTLWTMTPTKNTGSCILLLGELLYISNKLNSVYHNWFDNTFVNAFVNNLLGPSERVGSIDS